MILMASLVGQSHSLFGQDPFAQTRREMVEQYIESAGVKDVRVLQSIRETPRHEFVPRGVRSRAYLDMALPIGEAQTISSPFIVAMMTEALKPKPTDVVLEIGTGSGYQAAVLSPLVAKVYTIEIVPELGQVAADTLTRLNYSNVFPRIGDGFLGWPEAAPFDKIIVTCSPEDVPKPLLDQLREGGQMIIPVGERYQQTMYRMVKQNGKLIRQPLRPTLFVPMTGEAEAAREVHPDPQNPKVVNGDFEEGGESSLGKNGLVSGWYYGRQVKRLQASSDTGDAPSGKRFVRFENETPGLDSHLLQGVPIDGQMVSLIRLGTMVRTKGVRRGSSKEELPMLALTLYDKDRKELGTVWLGPYQGTKDWTKATRLVPIPPATREGILRIGLFGATGIADFDEISIKRLD
ncbi:protein-L-isoaspartate(D-aspartate) O-methyltransferase [bacterium]|nr:protein-L-isoaspartate(D-aspartate) O-methyltransferase [bacterium]